MAADLAIADQLTYCTIKIEGSTIAGEHVSGTGFFFSRDLADGERLPLIVTNRHVVEGVDVCRLTFHLADNGGVPQEGPGLTVEVRDFSQYWVGHPDDATDLAAIRLAPIIKDTQSRGVNLFCLFLDASALATENDLKQLTAIEEVAMVGYPIGLRDQVNNKPVVRRGSTATHPGVSYEGRREFLVDVACYPGSSGSPVFLYNIGSYAVREGGVALGNRVKLLGVLYAGPTFTAQGAFTGVKIPVNQQSVVSTRLQINLGYVVRASEIERLADEFLS